MKYLLFLLLLFNCSPYEPNIEINYFDGIELSVPSSQIVIYGNDNTGEIGKTLDLNYTTHWTSSELNLFDVKWICYKFKSNKVISKVVIENNYVNEYCMGDLAVWVSSNSSNGINGDWELNAVYDYNDNPLINGDGELVIMEANVKCVMFSMEYTGSGAYGGTPSFYITEVEFYNIINQE